MTKKQIILLILSAIILLLTQLFLLIVFSGRDSSVKIQEESPLPLTSSSPEEKSVGPEEEKGGNKKNEEAAKISFLFFGDIMLDRHVKDVLKRRGISGMLENLAGEEKRFFQGMDMISANLEGAVTKDGAHYPPELLYDFAFLPQDVMQLSQYRFSFFNLSNNHILDQGRTGYQETRENLKELGFQFSGCPDGEVGECSSTIVERGGKKIGMAGLSMVYSSLDAEKIRVLLQDLEKQTDMTVVNIHWGNEYEEKFNAKQQTMAHFLIDSGADVIIGHHPHVVQGVETYQGKPIFYSLGNFIFDQYFSRETQEGLAVGLTVEFPSDEDEIRFQYSLFPFFWEDGRAELMEDEKK